MTGCPLYTGWVKTANQIKALSERLRFFVCNLHQKVIDLSIGDLAIWGWDSLPLWSPGLASFWLVFGWKQKGCYF